MEKNILIILLLLISCFLNGQNLPELELRENKSIEIPEKLESNEIAVIFEQYGGWSAYNNLTYYIFKNNGEIIAYRKQTPKSYLKKKKELKETLTEIKLTFEQKKELKKNIESELTTDFLKYSQVSFKVSKKANGQCMITDATGYKMTFIQDDKQNSYKYYAPNYHLNKCKDKNINKSVLSKYLELIKLWKPKK
ncbi:hypothetical protein [uncultured Polaribacter sp.]|uniref:hypothetical protein n=1 Tax=uncultured Polaribacter sp. TaxID=174711 RepID=UPI00262C9BB1|nr:hypothetical protein [uncultured Polaribacter sp.]